MKTKLDERIKISGEERNVFLRKIKRFQYVVE